jgi:hypothetical protein
MKSLKKITVMGSENNYEFVLPNELEETPKDLHGETARLMFIVLSILGLKYTKKEK